MYVNSDKGRGRRVFRKDKLSFDPLNLRWQENQHSKGNVRHTSKHARLNQRMKGARSKIGL